MGRMAGVLYLTRQVLLHAYKSKVHKIKYHVTVLCIYTHIHTYLKKHSKAVFAL